VPDLLLPGAAVARSTAYRISRSTWLPAVPSGLFLRSYSKRATKTTRSPSSAGDETITRELLYAVAAGADGSSATTGQPAASSPVARLAACNEALAPPGRK
jgi:hypothetical protein